MSKNYIWLNPVVYDMTEEAERGQMLETLGFEELFCREDHIEAVRRVYWSFAAEEKRREQSGGQHRLVCDVRCPLAAALVKKYFPNAQAVYPQTLPILVRSAAELSARVASEPEARLTVIAPCEALCALGRQQNMPCTRFLTWKGFCREYGLRPHMKRRQQSPIPPGFFKGCAERVVSLDSREKILRFFAEQREEEADIAELLYCSGGCHNGEGMIGTEAVWS